MCVYVFICVSRTFTASAVDVGFELEDSSERETHHVTSQTRAMRTSRRATALTASVAFASAFTLARASASASACAQKGFDTAVCAQSACETLLDKTSSRTLYDECRACCPASNDDSVSATYVRARLRVCK
jgi:hypothetical protein